jgi:hypothetical protein
MIGLADAAAILPGHPCPKTVLRWCKKGCHGIKLKSVVMHGVRMTTEEWIFDFKEKVHEFRLGQGAKKTRKDRLRESRDRLDEIFRLKPFGRS